MIGSSFRVWRPECCNGLNTASIGNLGVSIDDLDDDDDLWEVIVESGISLEKVEFDTWEVDLEVVAVGS